MVSYRILLAASISTLGVGAALAQAPAERDSRPAMQLTALDYIEIEQLNRKYAWAIDTCADDGFEYADLYTPDGVFISGDNGRRWQGREQLAEAAGGNGRGCPFVRMPLSHVIVNLVIEATPDGAIGKSYLVYPGKNGQYADDKHHGHDGGYQDVYVKTEGGWRFKERVHVHPPQIPGQYVGVPNTELDAARNAPVR
jgi:ketosteroid isomerase-like protein